MKFYSLTLIRNKEQDEADSEEVTRSILRIDDGVCPSSCARLVEIRPNYFECPVCKAGVLKQPK